MFSEYGAPRVRFVRAGTLDEPSAVAPDVHIYTRSKVGWLVLPEDVPATQAAGTSSAGASFDWLSASATAPAPSLPQRPARADAIRPASR